jgi:predicted nucleotidyltransferase
MSRLIGDALFTKTQQKVLGLLYGKPDKRFYTNEIVRWADMGRGTIGRELVRLEQAGVLVVTQEGNQHYYQANSLCPVFDELKSLVRKTFGLRGVIAAALAPLLDNVDLAFIYGSMAKGGDHQASDVDLMLVGDSLNYGEVMELLLPVEESQGRPVNPTLYSPDDFKIRLREGNSFLVRLLEQPKLMIKGVINDFR